MDSRDDAEGVIDLGVRYSRDLLACSIDEHCLHKSWQLHAHVDPPVQRIRVTVVSMTPSMTPSNHHLAGCL